MRLVEQFITISRECWNVLGFGTGRLYISKADYGLGGFGRLGGLVKRGGTTRVAEVTWFKVLTDIFADDKIKILQSMPEGDALLVMWFKVLSQAGKTNDGGYIYLRKNIPYTSAMLATLFNKQQMIVDIALRTFEQFEMIDVDENGYIFVTNWEKHQNIEGMDKVREQNRLRNKSYRDKKRLELPSTNVTRDVTTNVTRRSNDATELELDIEIKDIPDSDECGEMFKKFWKAYPNKKGKSDAERKWKIFYRDKKLNFEEVMDGLSSYIEFCQSKDRPFKDGSTFVNSRAWEDDWTVQTSSERSRNTTSSLPLHIPDESRNEVYERYMAERSKRNSPRGAARDSDSAS